MNTQKEISCSLIRGGTSRGAFFLADDLPADSESRDRLLIRMMGGPDALQVDGLGGGHPLTSKVAVVSKSSREDADIDYLFLQVSPTEQNVNDAQNCGNILAGVGPFAIDNRLIVADAKETRLIVHMVNSGNLCELVVSTPGGAVRVEGATKIDGVPGTGAAIVCNYLDIAGSVTGQLLPTGKMINEFDGVKSTCIDNGMPVVVMLASDFGISGAEKPEDLDSNRELKRRVENIRLQAGASMGLGDVGKKTVPKMCLVSPSKGGNVIDTRIFIPHSCHRAIGVLSAVSVATACLRSESVCFDIAKVPVGSKKTMDIGHPSGSFQVSLTVDESASPEALVKKAGVIRTARTIMRGNVLVPRSAF